MPLHVRQGKLPTPLQMKQDTLVLKLQLEQPKTVLHRGQSFFPPLHSPQSLRPLPSHVSHRRAKTVVQEETPRIARTNTAK